MTTTNSTFTPKESYSTQELIDCGKGLLFGPDKAKLPIENMLMVDRICKINSEGGEYSRGKIVAELDIKPNLWFFDCHFAGDPVMPGCLGLDALWQLVGFYLAWSGHSGKGRALGAGDVKFTGEILPTSQLVTYELDFSRIIDRKLVMAIADGAVFVDGRKIYTAKITDRKSVV